MLQRLRGHRGDEGFSMVEVVVALMLFGILASAVAVTLGHVLTATRDDQSRALAANLATRVIDRLHAVSASQLPDGVQAPQMFTSDGRQFSVVTATALVAEGTSATGSACDSGGALSARRISVVVTWAGMGSTRPVRADTLRRLNVTELDATKGTISTKVTDRNGSPAANHVVTLTPGAVTYTTGADGCAVFSGLTPGPYAVSLNTAGYVDPTGTTVPARSVTATAGVVTKDPGFSYDRAATLAASWAVASGDTAGSYPVPTGTGVVLGHSAYSGSGSARSFPSCPATPACSTASGTTGATVAGLFPSTEGYRTWAGACADARTSTSPSPTVLQPGALTSVSVAPVRVRVQIRKKPKQTYVSTVTVTHAADTGCPGGFSVTLAVTNGAAAVGLPAGAWTFSISGDSATPTLAPGSSPTTVQLVMP